MFAVKVLHWRLFEIRLAVKDDPGKDSYDTSEPLCQEVAARLNCKVLTAIVQAPHNIIYSRCVHANTAHAPAQKHLVK